MLKTLSTESAALSESAVLPLPHASGTNTIAPISRGETTEASSDSLFDQFAWLYIFCREKLFRDDTDRMIQELWPNGQPKAGEKLIELGCGPGFYSCQIAERFPQISVLGVDRSASQLSWAREKRDARNLGHCRFQSDNVLELSHPDDSF